MQQGSQVILLDKSLDSRETIENLIGPLHTTRRTNRQPSVRQAPVVQKKDNAIHRYVQV